jgi:predicted AAA+ superfamily ATPase
MKTRFLEQLLPGSNEKRLALITGARQTGKTTLAKIKYQDLLYINLDAIENRQKILATPAALWNKEIGRAILDEAQKEPALFEKIKYAFDEGSLTFSVLLGSSQILLLKKIRETLAGRIAIYELYPLTLAELFTAASEEIKFPLLDQLLAGESVGKVLEPLPKMFFAAEQAERIAAQDYLLQWGGMPALLAIPEAQRKKWLKDYEFTYLERDLTDLARISDLQPFRTLQRLAALRAACLLQYSELGRDAGISIDTTRRYLEYLRLSYQVFFLQPFHRNLTSSLVKTPKLYWVDVGILKSITGTTDTTGAIYENMVISEIMKWVKIMQREVNLFFYRTRSGMEIDLILELPKGIIGVEIKSRNTFVKKDCTGLREIAAKLGSEWLGGLVIYNGNRIAKIADPNIWAIPAWRIFT